MLRDHDHDDHYLKKNINNCCRNGTLSENGSTYLTHRLVKFVTNINANNHNKRNTTTRNITTNDSGSGSGSGSDIRSSTHKNDNDNKNDNNNNKIVIQIFNDHDMQILLIQRERDGQHFRGLICHKSVFYSINWIVFP